MATLPLGVRLRRRGHREVALAQDLLVMSCYDHFPRCVLHGGTAIWRCYRGGRFSEDIDLYLGAYGESDMRRFREGLAAKGMTELKFKATQNTIFGKFGFSGATVSLEVARRASPPHLVKSYEALDGSLMMVNTLSPEEFVIEKSAAYADRRKVRDLYDVFFLLNLVKERETVAGPLSRMISGYQRPVDEAQLKAIIIAGAVPSADAMLGAIKKWAGQFT